MNIMCPGISAWSWMMQRPQQLLRAAARAGHRCFYVEPEGGADGREVEPGVYLYGDFTAARRDAGSYVLYFTNPLIPVEIVRNGPVVFDAVDDFPGTEAILARCAQAADRVICTSDGVRARLRQAGIEAVLIPNACDYEHWSGWNGPSPVDVEVLPRPLAVFIGAVANWVDVGLVAACARAQPDAGFLFVGPHLATTYMNGNTPANVWAFGIRPYESVPAYAHAADVLLLPFREDVQEARAANPVKVWEYLATGKPVVCTRIPEVLPLEPLVRAASGESFVSAVAAAMREDGGLAPARRRLAAENTWDQRWLRVEAVLG